jgi:cysteine desulfurase
VLAIQGVVRAAEKSGIKKPHVVVGAIEHAAVLETLLQLKEEGDIDLAILSTDENGLYKVEELKNLVNKNTVLVSLMMINNEIGVVQDVISISKEVRRLRKVLHDDRHATYPVIHTDASQAVFLHDIDVRKLGADIISFGGSKLYGPSGVGVLYIKRGTPIESPWYGGGQEFGLRPGTESTALIAGLSKAVELSFLEKESNKNHVTSIQKYFLEKVKNLSSDQMLSSLGLEMRVYGESEWHSSHMVYVLVKGLESDQLVIELDARRVYVSAKSACKTLDPQTSHVLRALGYKDNSWGGVRFSFGRETIKKDVDYAVAAYREVLVKLLHTKKEFNL